MYIYIYIYICVCVCMCVCVWFSICIIYTQQFIFLSQLTAIYLFTYLSVRQSVSQPLSLTLPLSLYIYIYIYMFICTWNFAQAYILEPEYCRGLITRCRLVNNYLSFLFQFSRLEGNFFKHVYWWYSLMTSPAAHTKVVYIWLAGAITSRV